MIDLPPGANGVITAINSTPTGAASSRSAVEISTTGIGYVGVQITGTYTGAMSAQVTVDGLTWVTLGATSTFTRQTTGVATATITSAEQDVYVVPVKGAKKFRVTALGAVTGTAQVTMQAADMGSGGGSSSSGTVTNTGGVLTSNSLVLGNGGVDTKVSASLGSDGVGRLALGTAASVEGSAVLYNATSGSVVIKPVTGALGSTVLLLPAGSDTFANLAGAQTFTNKTLTAPTVNGAVAGTATLPATVTMIATPSQADSSTKVATTAYVDTLGATKAPLYADVALTGANTLTSAAHAFRNVTFTGAAATQTMGAGTEGAVIELSHNGTGQIPYSGLTVPTGFVSTLEAGETGQVKYTGGLWRSLIPSKASAAATAKPGREPSWGVFPLPASTTITSVGITAPAILDTSVVTAVTPTDTREYTLLHRNSYVSFAAINRNAGANIAVASRPLHMPTVAIPTRWKIRIIFGAADALTGTITAVGVIAPAFPAAVEPSTRVNMILVAADSSHTNLSIMHNASGTATQIALGASFPANTNSLDMYELTLLAVSTASVVSVDYTVTNLITDAVATGTITTNLPAAGTSLSVCWVRGTAANATAATLEFGGAFAGFFAQ